MKFVLNLGPVSVGREMNFPTTDRRCAQRHLSHAMFERVQFFTVCLHSVLTCTFTIHHAICDPRVVSRSLPHLTLTTSTSSLSPTSPIFQSFSPSQSCPLVQDLYTCDDPQRSGGSTEIPSPTGYEPKMIGCNILEPRRIELDRNPGKDLDLSLERTMGDDYQNPITEDMDEFGKAGVEMSCIQSRTHSDYDSAESTADSDLEDGELQKKLASPLHTHGRGGHFDSSRRPMASNWKQK